MAFTLKKIVPWGRSFEEYVRMFHLTAGELRKDIISCGDGPASFNAGMRKRGSRMVSCDPIYAFSAQQIRTRIKETYGLITEQLRKNSQDYLWTMFKDPEEVVRVRMQAMRDFLEDYTRGKKEGRYIAGTLPKLAFEDNRFDLSVCSHFLFLYTEHLSLDFHIKAIVEMLRVAKETRIFPLLQLDGKKSPYVKDIVREFRKKKYNVVVSKVKYEFQRGGDDMLSIKKFSSSLAGKRKSG